MPGYKKRMYKKKVKGPLTTAQVKAVTKIAKKVDIKNDETKSAFVSRSVNLFDSVVYASNLNYFITNDATNTGLIGNKMYLKNIHIKGQVAKSGTGTRDTNVRLMVIRTDQQLTATTNGVTYSNIFRTSSNTALPASALHVDFNKVKLLYDKHFQLKAPYANWTPTHVFDILIKINRSHKYEGSSGYLEGGNYYFIMISEDQTAATNAALGYDLAINFKDA